MILKRQSPGRIHCGVFSMNEYSPIQIRNIFHMLCYAFRILRQKNYARIETESFSHVQDMLAMILSRGVAQQLKQGLTRTYIEHNDQSKSLRGKLNPYETRRLQKMRIQKFDCTYDDLSVDNEMNQILKATMTALIRCREVDAKRKQELRQEILFFSSIADIDVSQVQWGRLLFHRNNRSYEMLMNICRMVWDSLLPTVEQGNIKFSLFDEESMPHLYEKFILEYYRQHFPSLHADDKSVKWDIPDDTDPGMIRLLPGMHTDITLRNSGKTLIIDAKYYQKSLATHMGKQMLHSANLYQIYTYVKNEDKQHTGNVSGMLLYAKTDEEVSPWLSVPIGGNRISVRTLDLNRSFVEISESLDRIAYECFGDALRRIA